ncbi:MAG: GNAT family N-acetyltransferase [Tissierellales bacterium]|jgi:ribosomal protein S18 acetylase RimI-like enzyme|nr:GNAT family N-acetyltransferase [Tissierellales bacterium]
MIIYKDLNQSHIHYAAKFLCESFLTEEPLTNSLNIAPSRFYNLCSRLLENLQEQGLSKIAVHEEKIIGLILIRDENQAPVSINLVNSETPELLTIFDFEEKLYKIGCFNMKEKSAHIEMIAISKSYHRNGIGRNLVSHSISKLIDSGYEQIMVFCTNPKSQKLFKSKFDFQSVSQIDVTTYEYDNKTPFKGVLDYQYGELVTKLL